jgi:hypothetical protein
MSISHPQASVTELSIADIHACFAQGHLTCAELTQRLLQRIERFLVHGAGDGEPCQRRAPIIDTILGETKQAGEPQPAGIAALLTQGIGAAYGSNLSALASFQRLIRPYDERPSRRPQRHKAS